MDTTLHIKALDLDESDLSSFQGLADDENTRWYYERRRQALVATGVLAAGKWDPLMHPRGVDGRFIDKFGFVRWLVNGEWQRGQVTEIGSNGDLTVKSSKGDHKFTNVEARRSLYGLPKPKAQMVFPDPKGKGSAPGFTKIGGQGGSNPGGLYEVTNVATGNKAFTAETLKTAYQQLRLGPDGKNKFRLISMDLDINETPEVIRSRFEKDGFITDVSKNKVYIVQGGTIRELGTLETVTPLEMFGAPGSSTRLGALDKMYMLDRLESNDVSAVRQTMDSLVQVMPDLGDQFYVKSAKSEDHAKVEALANWLYELGGVPVPDVSIGNDKITVASKIVGIDSAETLTLSDGLKDPQIASRIRQDMVFDAWLANWDVAGLSYDNIIIVEGVPYRVDAGGALTYRAQGGSKGNKFGNTVGELATLKNQSMNPQAAKVFGPVTQEELKLGGERLAAITPAQIQDAVAEAGLDEAMANTLIARRADVLSQLGIDVSVVTPSGANLSQLLEVETPPVTVPSDGFQYPLDLTGKVWNPALKNFVDGKTEPYWSALLEGFRDSTQSPLNTEYIGPVEIMNRQSEGTPVYVLGPNDQMYSLMMKYNGSTDNYDMNYTHVVTGKKYSTSYSGGTMGVLKPSVSPDVFRTLYRQKATRVVDVWDKTSEIELASKSNNPDLATQPIFPGYADYKPGDWILDSKLNKFVKIEAVKSDRLEVTNLDGYKITLFLPLSSLNFRRPNVGSFLDDVLDSMEARNAVSKKNDSGTFKSDVTPGDKLLQQSVASAPNVTVSETIVDGPPAGWYQSDKGLNKAISIHGDFALVKDMSADEVKELVGKQVFVQIPSDVSSNPARALGVFTVVSTDVASNGNQVLNVRDAVGHTKKFGPYGETIELAEIAATLPPITQFQLKTNNTIVVNGEVVGSWKKNFYTYQVVIDEKYSATGEKYSLNVHHKSAIKEFTVAMVVPPGSAMAVPKSDKNKSLEKTIREADIKFSEPSQLTETGSAKTLLDGAEITNGMWVISKTDGSVGQVSGVSTSYLGYVNVKTADGKTKVRAAKTLSAASDPTGTIVPSSPLYKDVKLSDGSQAFPSQKVLSGSSELVLMQVKPDGSVLVSHTDGKKTWMSSSKLAPAQPYVPEQPEDKAVIMASLDDGWKTAPKAKKIPYAAPDGSTIPQQPDAVEKYRQYAVTRKLTRDNFVPQIGMKVRDSNGNQLTIVRIADTTTSNPSAVWVYNHSDFTVTVRQPSVLWVDHAAELATPDGKPLPKIGGLYFQKTDSGSLLPSGTIIYQTTASKYINGRTQPVNTYFASMPDGRVTQITSNSSAGGVWKNDLQSVVTQGMVKVAYVDESSDGMMTIESHDTWGQVVSAVYIHKDEPGELEKIKDEIAAKQIAAGVVEPETFAGNQKQLIRLPKPDDASAPTVSALKPAAATGDGSVLKGPAAVSGSLSVDTGIQRLLAQRGSDTVGQSVVYAMGDSDYIEDMSIRLHMATDPVSGDEYVEMRFGLLEGQADDLAKHLITNNGTVVGDWTQATVKMPQDLKSGDPISVKISSSTGALKPGGESFPNAKVVGTPQLVGVSKSGLDAYKVDVAMASGATGHIIIEARTTPSVRTFEWDPTRVATSGSFNGSINSDAVSMGWTVRNQNAVAYESNGKILLDAQGQKILKKDDDGIKAIASLSGAARMQYDHPGGGFMSVQVVHPDAESRSKDVDYNKGIRSSVNGEVLIRVKANDPDALQKISDMMAAAGVPPEKQGQPSSDDLTKMALNKVYKQFNGSYTHTQQANVAGSNDTAGVASVLSKIDAAVGPALGRKASLDDVRLRVMPDGRVTVVLSDEVADAVVKTADMTYAAHSFTGSGYKPEIFSSRASAGLMSTDERWSLGILTSGMSNVSDVTNDSGNRVYLRLSSQSTGAVGRSGQVLVSARAVAKTTDWYWNAGDRFGRRGSNNLNWKTSGKFDVGSGNEIMMKRKLDPEIMGFVTFGSASSRANAIEDLSKQGVTMIGDRPVEDVFVVEKSKTVQDLAALGTNIGIEIPLTGLIA